MTGRELVKAFRAADWTGAADIGAMVQATAVPGFEPADLIKLLDVLGNRSLAKDARTHSMRFTAFRAVVEARAHKSLFRPFVKALKSADPQVRKILVELIPKVNDITAHDELCAVMRSKDEEVRQAVAAAMIEIGGKTVLRILGDMIGEPGFSGRKEAVEVVVKVAGPYAVPTLRNAISVGPLPDKIHALRFLGDPRYMSRDIPGAVRAIEPVLKELDDGLVAQAILAYGNLCTEEQYFEKITQFLDSGSLKLVQASLLALRRFSSPRVMAVLDRKLRVGPKSIRLAVLDALEAMGSDAILPPLVQALGHRQIAVRQRAGEVLAELNRSGKLDLARTIVWLLRSGDVQIRRMAAELANSVSDPENQLWPKLVSCLRDEDWWVRERILDALIQMAGPELARHVLVYLTDESDVIRRFGVDVLARLKDPRSVGALVRVAMSDSDWWVREKAILAVAEINDERTVPHIVHIMRDQEDARLACLEALTLMQARDAASDVAALLSAEDDDVRQAALDCLMQIGGPEFVEAVRPLLGDPEPRVRKRAREILLRWNVSLSQDDMAVSDGMLSPLEKFLVTLANKEGDDLLLAADRLPYLKKLGKMVPLADRMLTGGQVQALVLPLLSGRQIEELRALRDIDLSYEVPSHDLRFRVNVFNQRSGLCAVFRIVKGDLPELEGLGLPGSIHGTGNLKNGLVLMGGPTGSGKSTTLAAIINRINQTQDRHIISLEDPIEVRHESKSALVNQREVGTHARSYASALRSTLRQDPDVILIGELRDLPTISFAVSAAETGHLVFGTVHTVSVETSMDRLINTFPAGQQDQVRSMLAESLRVVLCQYLLQRKDEPGRVLACEVMFNNDAISNLIRKGNSYQIPSIIATSRELGMQLMDQDLMRLYKEGKVHAEEVYMKANTKKDFEFLVGEGPMPGSEVTAPRGEAAPAQPTVVGAGSGPAATPPAGGQPAAGRGAAPGTTRPQQGAAPGVVDSQRAASGPGARGVMDAQRPAVPAPPGRPSGGGKGGPDGAPSGAAE